MHSTQWISHIFAQSVRFALRPPFPIAFASVKRNLLNLLLHCGYLNKEKKIRFSTSRGVEAEGSRGSEGVCLYQPSNPLILYSVHNNNKHGLVIRLGFSAIHNISPINSVQPVARPACLLPSDALLQYLLNPNFY